MRLPIILSATLVVTLLLTGISNAQDTYALEIKTDRALKDAQLKSRKESPLQKKDRKAFSHLNYFDVNPEYRVEAEFELLEEQQVMEIPTSAGYAKFYKAYGVLRFELNDRSFSITAFKRYYPDDPKRSEAVDYLFVPFTDLTTGDLTYGGGRYLDIPIPANGATVVLDFNRCYNPYCAYGAGFACPIPPKQNFIKAEIKAGEMAYSGGDH